ncbi:MAG TPA: extracellular solute-binding protein [Limnochordales bacterium]|nr:extracellular solute-binding protein [Limnochordales bacterium]
MERSHANKAPLAANIPRNAALEPTAETKTTRREWLQKGAKAAAAMTAAGTFWSSLNFYVNAQSRPVLRITGWGGAYGDLYQRHVIPAFEKEYNCRVEVDTAFPFEPKLLASPRNRPIYDVFHSNNQPVTKVMEAGYLEENLTASEIPNLRDCYDYVTAPTVPGIAAFVSGIGLGYRTDLVEGKLDSWQQLWEERFAGRRGTYVITNELGIATLLMAGEIFGSGYQDLDAAFEAIAKLRPIKLADFTGTMERMLLTGEVVVGVIHDSGIWRHVGDAPVDWAFVKEGIPALEQVMNVTKGSDKKELAYAWLNHILSPEVQRLMGEELGYGVANKTVRLSGKYEGRTFDTPEKVALLKQFDWSWYNKVESTVTRRFLQVMGG